MNKAVIFDMDGVLIDSEIVFTKCLSKAFEAAGYDVPAAEFYRFAGIEFPRKFQTVINEKNLPVTVEELSVHYRNVQKVLLQDFGPMLKPGVLPTLQSLRSAGYRTALCSNSVQERVDKVFADTGLTGLFDVVITGEVVPRRKPDPCIYLLTLDSLGLSPKDCIAVEDSIFGITAAKAAGLVTIEVRDPRFPYQDGLADVTIDNLSQLPKILERFV